LTILGQSIIVENVAGAGGTIGVTRLARAAPDGYTIDIGQWDTHVASIIYGPNYDLKSDFAPIGLVSMNPVVMTARKNLPVEDLTGLIAWMRENPGKINLANQLAGSVVAATLFEQLTGQKVQLIPYRGAAPAMTDIIAGRVDLLVAQSAIVVPYLRAGTIKALANLSKRRPPSIPDIATSDESGLQLYGLSSGAPMSWWWVSPKRYHPARRACIGSLPIATERLPRHACGDPRADGRQA
jgi:tripartite-type tricarboxylate transporter receptor subunit TctC